MGSTTQVTILLTDNARLAIKKDPKNLEQEETDIM